MMLRNLMEKAAGYTSASKFITWSLILVSLWILASLFWLIIFPLKPPTPNFIGIGSPNNTVNLTVSPFNEQAASSQSPMDSSQFALQGVFQSNNPVFSSAVIKNNANNESREYRVGMPISSTPYTLAQVGWNSATLEDGSGKSYELKMGRLGLNNPTINEPVSNGGVTNNLRDNSPVNSYNNPSINNAGMSPEIERALAAGAGSLNNPSAALSDMGLTPTGQGYEVTAQTPEETRRNMGLQPGDKITAINGQRLGAPQQDAQVFEKMLKDRNGVVEIKRGNQVITTQQRF